MQVKLVCLILLLLFCPTIPPGQAKQLSLSEVKANLKRLRDNSPHTKCIKESDIKSCAELIVGSDEDVYFNEIMRDLTVEKKVALSNYFIDYVLNNGDILSDRRLSEKEKEMRIDLHRRKFTYGTFDRVPLRLVDQLYAFDTKSSNFLRFISTPPQERTYEYLKKAAMQKDDAPDEKYGRMIAQLYYQHLVKDMSALPIFCENVLSNCGLCDKEKYIQKFLNMPSFGKNISAGAPKSSIEFKYVFKPAIVNKYIDKKISLKYQHSMVTSVAEIPYFIDNVLNQCRDCDKTSFYNGLLSTPGFGDNLPSFFDSIEYRYVLKNMPPGKIAHGYVDCMVKSKKDIPKFYREIFGRYKGLDEKEYYPKLMNIPDFGQNLTSFFDSLEYHYVLKNLPPVEMAYKYIDFMVEGVDKIPRFYSDFLNRFPDLNEQKYYAKLISLPDFGIGLTFENLTESIEYKYILKNITLRPELVTNGKTYSVVVKTGYNKDIKSDYSSVCKYTHADSRQKDIGFFETLFSGGAVAKRIHYDVYNCKPTSKDLKDIETASNFLADMRVFKTLSAGHSWEYYKAAGETLVYPPPSAVNTYGTNDYQDSSSSGSRPSSSSRSSQSAGSTKKVRTIKRMYDNGRISGVPSYGIECTGGSSYVIYYKNGTWYSGSTGHMGNKYDSWSKEDVGRFLCR